MGQPSLSDHRDWVYSAVLNGHIFRDKEWKWIRHVTDDGPFDEVYDLMHDPRECVNVADSTKGQETMSRFRPLLQDLAITEFRRMVTDLHPQAIQPRLIPFFTT